MEVAIEIQPQGEGQAPVGVTEQGERYKHWSLVSFWFSSIRGYSMIFKDFKNMAQEKFKRTARVGQAPAPAGQVAAAADDEPVSLLYSLEVARDLCNVFFLWILAHMLDARKGLVATKLFKFINHLIIIMAMLLTLLVECTIISNELDYILIGFPESWRLTLRCVIVILYCIFYNGYGLGISYTAITHSNLPREFVIKSCGEIIIRRKTQRRNLVKLFCKSELLVLLSEPLFVLLLLIHQFQQTRYLTSLDPNTFFHVKISVIALVTLCTLFSCNATNALEIVVVNLIESTATYLEQEFKRRSEEYERLNEQYKSLGIGPTKQVCGHRHPHAQLNEVTSGTRDCQEHLRCSSAPLSTVTSPNQDSKLGCSMMDPKDVPRVILFAGALDGPHANQSSCAVCDQMSARIVGFVLLHRHMRKAMLNTSGVSRDLDELLGGHHAIITLFRQVITAFWMVAHYMKQSEETHNANVGLLGALKELTLFDVTIFIRVIVFILHMLFAFTSCSKLSVHNDFMHYKFIQWHVELDSDLAKLVKSGHNPSRSEHWSEFEKFLQVKEGCQFKFTSGRIYDTKTFWYIMGQTFAIFVTVITIISVRLSIPDRPSSIQSANNQTTISNSTHGSANDTLVETLWTLSLNLLGIQN